MWLPLFLIHSLQDSSGFLTVPEASQPPSSNLRTFASGMNSVLEEQALAQFISGELVLVQLSVQSGGSKRGSLLIDTLPNRPLIRQVVFHRGVLFVCFSDPTPVLRRLRRALQRGKTPSYETHDFMANRWGKNGSRDRFYFLGLQNHCRR